MRLVRHEPTSINTFAIVLGRAVINKLGCCPYCRHDPSGLLRPHERTELLRPPERVHDAEFMTQ